jgi:hypothetical protein
LPQPPQFAGSNRGFAQNIFVGVAGSAQKIPGAGQPVPPPVVHTPPKQACPAAHTVPHEPQLAGS